MKKIIFLFLSALFFLQASAQKLPNIQQVSVKAPANIKIDGKANDWDNKFEANNITTELLYTIANDDKKLYLIAQTTSPMVMNRIAGGGIKLIIQKNGTKTDAGAPYVKFPFLKKSKLMRIYFLNIRKTGKNGMERAPEPKNAQEAEKIADSIAKDINKMLMREHKWIYTSGIAGVDTSISVYNEKGIQAANAVNSKKAYTYELAIDLKLLGLQGDKADKFLYHIVVNGEPNKALSLYSGITYMGRADGSSTAEAIQKENDKYQRMAAEESATTDFWGEYTLAK